MAVSVLLFIGSTRQGRQSRKPAHILERLLREKNIDLQVIDLQELHLPFYDDDIETEGKEKLLAAFKKADGVIIVSPEYNHSIPASVKNAIDVADGKELYGKPLSVVGASDGDWGGARMVQALRIAWLGDGGIALPLQLLTPHVDAFDTENPPAEWLSRAEKFIDESIKWFTIIRLGKSEK